MLDNQLIALFLPLIQNGLTSMGYTGVIVKQSNQPTQQGINTQPTVYFFKVGDKRYGWLKRIDTWDATTNVMSHIEMQVYETTFQINALVLQFPQITTLYTASDLVNAVAAIMQSSTTITALAAGGAGILRVTDVRNPYFIDDRDNFEASPSFDFTLTHEQTIITQDPIITEYDYTIKNV